MEEKKVTRSEFLKNSSKYAMGAAAGVVGLNILGNNKLNAQTTGFSWPYPYATIDPEVARIKAHTLYYSGKDCCSGVFGGLVECLKTEVGDPWTNFPIEVMLFGRGGGVGWGSICGALNGAAALISLVTDKAPSGALINEVWGWSTTEMLPTDTANSATYEIINYTDDMPQNIAGSPLCHASVSQWAIAAGAKVHDASRKERCARLAGDLAAKTAEILNAHFAETFVGTFSDSDTVKACLSCHGSAASDNVMTHMECSSCHGDPHGTVAVEPINEMVPSHHTLSQNYPNPFNPNTSIKFSIPKTGKVRIEVYNIKGQLVNSLVDSEVMNPGEYNIKWNGTDNSGQKVATGLYIARLTTGDFMKSIKMNLIK